MERRIKCESLEEALRPAVSKTVRVYFGLRSKPENLGLVDTKIMAEMGSMDKIYYKDGYEGFVDRVKGKSWHKNDFLAELGSDILGDADC